MFHYIQQKSDGNSCTDLIFDTFEPLLYLCGFACCFWSLTKCSNLNNKAEARGRKRFSIFPISSTPHMLISASSLDFSSKSFDFLAYCRRLFTFIAQQRLIPYTKSVSVCVDPGMTRSPSHQAAPAEHFEVRPMCCAPPHCRRAADHWWELQRQVPIVLHRDKVLLPGAAMCRGGSLIHGSSRTLGEACSRIRQQNFFWQGFRKNRVLSSCWSQLLPRNLASQLWLRACLHWMSWLSGLSHTLWESPTSRIQLPVPMTGRLCIRNGVLGCVLAGKRGQVFVWQSQTFSYLPLLSCILGHMLLHGWYRSLVALKELFCLII